MITKEYGKFFGVCDCCQEEATPVFSNWRECREYLKDNGWQTRKDKTTGEWENFCPRCKALDAF